MPAWAFSLAPRWLGQARALVRELGLRLILDLNLITDTPGAAAQWARAAQAGLPRHSIDAFEVGNEPDIYSRADWLAITAGRGAWRIAAGGRAPLAGAALPAALTARDYVRDFHAYAARAGRGRPAGDAGRPALANPVRHGRWVQTPDRRRPPRRWGWSPSIATPTPAVRTAAAPAPTPRSAGSSAPRRRPAWPPPSARSSTPPTTPACRCASPSSTPSIAGAGPASATRSPPLCGPPTRCSRCCAPASTASTCTSAPPPSTPPFALGPAGLQARPLLYGLILFARALGPRAQLVTRLLAPQPPRQPRGLGGPGRARHAPRPAHRQGPALRRGCRCGCRPTGRAEVQRLLAPSAAARTGVTLGGPRAGRRRDAGRARPRTRR